VRVTSWFILLAAGVLHGALLIGWRWQQPLVPYFFDATVLSGARGLDFYAMYQAGYNARHAHDVYEADPRLARVVVPYSTPFRYLPITAYVVGGPLSLLSPLTAYKLWVVVIELTLLACVFVTWANTRQQPDLFARLAAMWLVFTPFYLEMFMGQFSFVQAALVFGMLVLGRRCTGGRGPGRGFDILWISSVLWKINTVLFVPVFWRLQRWKAIVAAGVLAAGTTLPYFAVFPRHWHGFVANNFGSTVSGHELGNLGLRQLVYELLARMGATPALQQFAQASLVLAVLAIALTLTLRYPRARLESSLWLWLTAFFLLSPHVWEHHYVMLLPVLVTAYWQRPGKTVATLWVLLAMPTPFGFIGLESTVSANHALRAFPIEPAWQPLLQHASKAIPAAILFVHCGRQMAVAEQPPTEDPAAHQMRHAQVV
jgi:hypothetical protein